MTITIGSNIDALRLSRRLGESSRTLSQTFQRLASGLRINGAADDAAGLAVATGLDFKSRVFGRASLNVNDGISALQIADGAIGQVSVLLQRMAELAEQSANGSLSDSQRQSLDKEYQQLDKEIRRITSSTQFNQINLLNGSVGTSLNSQAVTNAGAGGVASAFAVSGDGRYIAYYDAQAGQLKQLNTDTRDIRVIATITAPGFIRSDAAGGVVSFESTANLTGQNGGGAEQLYVWNRYTNEIRQITNSQGTNTLYSSNISGDGSTVSIATNTDYVDGGTVWSGATATALNNLYTINLATGKVTAVVEGSVGELGYESLSTNGRFLVFQGVYNPFGTNPDLLPEIFVTDLAAGASSTRQVTSTANLEIALPEITNSGDIFWISSLNHTGQNAGGYQQLFKYSYANSSITQFTSSQTPGLALGDIALSADGETLNVFAISGAIGLQGDVSIAKYNTTTLSLEENVSVTGAIAAFASFNISADGNSVYGASTAFTGNSDIIKMNGTRSDLSTLISTGTGSSGAINTEIGALNGTLRGLGTLTLGTQNGARGALDTIQDNMQRLSLMQSKIGAGLSRLESANKLIRDTRDLYIEAKSRITDIDVAAETANMIKAQITQQAATALMAQVKIQPQLALQLLKI